MGYISRVVSGTNTLTFTCYSTKPTIDLTARVNVSGNASPIYVSPVLTLAADGWSNNEQTITYSHNVDYRNVIDVMPESITEWIDCGVYAYSETATGFTFRCSETPTNDISIKVTSMEVAYL